MRFEKFITKATMYYLWKLEPHRRKNYRKARFRKMATRFELRCVLEEIQCGEESQYVVIDGDKK